MPNNCVFLVDTYDTLEGVRHAVEVGRRAARAAATRWSASASTPATSRTSASRPARSSTTAASPRRQILASNDLDEHIIASLKEQGATIDVWGVGTKLVTAYDQPALGGVYKLAALRERRRQPWQYKVKLSEQAIKVSNPGVLQVRRFRTRAASSSPT